MNSYFYRIFIPFVLFGLLGAIVAINNPLILWWTLGFWFLIGFIGQGVSFHRLFSHRQFETYRAVELFLALAGTLTAYGPLLYWVGSHSRHHKYADTEQDPTNASKGLWFSAVTWNLTDVAVSKRDLLAYPCKRILKDKMLMWISNHFEKICWGFFLILLVIDWQVASGGYALAALIERIRIGVVVNWLLHQDWVPGAYRNHDCDSSVNNQLLLPLTLGFSLHNNHHKNYRRMNESEHWYEIDFEYLFIKLIRKKNDLHFGNKSE